MRLDFGESTAKSSKGLVLICGFGFFGLMKKSITWDIYKGEMLENLLANSKSNLKLD